VAADGQEALKHTRTDAFDLIFMDLEMPGVDGLEVTREIRKSEAPGLRVPIYALTAHVSAGYRQQCLAANMDGFITKPISVEELLNLVSRTVPSGIAREEDDPISQSAADPITACEDAGLGSDSPIQDIWNLARETSRNFEMSSLTLADAHENRETRPFNTSTSLLARDLEVRETPILRNPFEQARNALRKSRFDVRMIHNDGDPSNRNLI
jgi:CheY-like chemotaxis protein